jgi:hypothetical protein
VGFKTALPRNSRKKDFCFIISKGIVRMGSPTPVHFFSHGSTMMLGEESASATYWKKCGDEALKNGVKHVVMMVFLLSSARLR